MTEHEWKVHTPNLLREVLQNPGTSILAVPLSIFGRLLAEVAERAIALDDPKLNILMLRLTLYDQGDPALHGSRQLDEAYASQRRRIKNSK